MIIINENEDIVMARSKKFKDVLHKRFIKGAILINRNRFYVNRGDENKSKWELILPNFNPSINLKMR